MGPEYEGGPRFPSLWTLVGVVLLIYLLIPLLKMILPVLGVIAALLFVYKLMFQRRI